MATTNELDQIEHSTINSRNGTPTHTKTFRVNHILAPTDLSRESRKTVNYAMWLARRFYAKLTLLHVYQMPGTFECAFALPEAEILQQYKDRAKLNLLALYDVIRAQHPNTEPLFRCGEPRTEIPATARIRGVDLIVISTHGYRWLRRVVEGGDVQKIIHDAPCPVLIVREMSMTSWDDSRRMT
jgi:nucleotide-binding universal stress UspA family protein